ncbi:MAG: alpha-amylase family glycosyl hydrolase [Lachnospiraceae bacterium]|nr:alpha-amylase family glycosyl hydrolase [Lachnospiraceae bacterium]
MWADESVFYQIYPLGLCGAPAKNDGVLVNRIGRVTEWIPHLQKLGITAVYFSPIFESDEHGYDTRDYAKLDCRLGTNADFAAVCGALHEAGIRVVLDGVFNHVGRGFWAFQDVLANGWNSRYKDWFHIHFDGQSCYGDPFWYEGWEGCFNLVKLNLQNEEVVQYLLGAVEGWIREFDIDGLRLDVAYCLDPNFVRRLRSFCDGEKPEFWLCGEMLHGDYNRLMNDQMLHSVTNYECYKGLYSAFNSYNLFEIVHSLLRQFGPEPWTLYKGKHLLAFADNHDVTRVASILTNPQHLPLVYGMLFGMPGIPCVYYGSEWGMKGEKAQGDAALRPEVRQPEENELTRWIGTLAAAHRGSRALCYGTFRSLVLTNRQCVFERAADGERVLVCVNAEENDFDARFSCGADSAVDLLTGERVPLENGCHLEGYSVRFLRC